MEAVMDVKLNRAKPFDQYQSRANRNVHNRRRSLASKQATNRPHDQRVIPVLQNTLAR
jgi:hypothetical protein